MKRFLANWAIFLVLAAFVLVPAAYGFHFRDFLGFLGLVAGSAVACTVALRLTEFGERPASEAKGGPHGDA